MFTLKEGIALLGCDLCEAFFDIGKGDAIHIGKSYTIRSLRCIISGWFKEGFALSEAFLLGKRSI
jgi:hypothetical protein